MLLFRFAVFVLLGGAALCFAFFIGTGQERFKRWGVKALTLTVIAGLAFFAVLILERVG